MAKDVNIHLKTTGAAQTKQQLGEVGKASKRVGDQTATGQKRGADETEKTTQKMGGMGRVLGKLKTQVLSFVGAYAGLQGVRMVITQVTQAIRTQIQAIEEHAQIAAEQQKALIGLQFMGEFYKERPHLRKEVATWAEFGRRPYEEVAEAWYNLRSKAARLSTEQRQSIFKEALELGRAYPKDPLGTLVDMFTLYTKATKAQDINRVQNVLARTIEEAGGRMADVSKFMPRLLGPGMAAGLTGPEVAGLWAGATTLPEAPQPEIATTSLRNVLLALQGKGTPEAIKMLQGLGIRPGMGFFEQMDILATQRKAGRFALPRAELLAGREGMAMLLGLLREQEAIRETIANVVRADASQRDITAEALRGLMGADEIARREEEGRRLDIIIQNIKGADVRALRWKEVWRRYEIDLRKKGYPEWRIKKELGAAKIISGMFPGLVEPSAIEEKVHTEEAPVEQEIPTEIGPVSINYHNEIIYTPRWGSDERGERFPSELA